MIGVILLCLAFPLKISCNVYKNEVCGSNEEYTTCLNVCPDTCENYGTRRICDWKECKNGCQCKEGYVRDSRGNCIRPDLCTNPPVCGRLGEEYSECGSIDYCQLTCENLDNPPSLWCSKKFCHTGCFCKKGYVRDFKWNCIPKEECPKKTGPGFNCSKPNEFYESCGSSCPSTCENYDEKRICSKVCVKGCFCRDDFVRDSNSEDQLCIYPTHCTNPPVCIGRGEEYQFCGTHCPLTCDNYDSPPDCEPICKSGCFCKKGLVRDIDGECVLPRDCSKKHSPCREGEIIEKHGCEYKCTGLLQDYEFHCDSSFTESCSCKENLARHPINGTCIPKSDCPDIH